MANKSSNIPHLNKAQIQELSYLFKLLADPTRLGIIVLLMKEPTSVNEIADKLGLKQANTSKQLGLLHQGKLLKKTRANNSIFYSIRQEALSKLCHCACGLMHCCAKDSAFS